MEVVAKKHTSLIIEAAFRVELCSERHLVCLFIVGKMSCCSIIFLSVWQLLKGKSELAACLSFRRRAI